MALRVLLCSTFVLASYADLQPEFDQDVYDDAVDQNYSERDDDRRFSVPEQFEALNATAPLEEAEKGPPTIAEYIDTQLGKEFHEEELASQSKPNLNETLSKEKGSHLEQVVKVSTKKVKYNATEDATGQAENNSTSAEVTWDADPSGLGVDTSEPVRSKSESVEQDVDRLIDADSNEYVLSRPKGGVALTLDPLLIQDLTIVLTASSVFGALFEMIKQPVLNGYILAGSLIGPDGLALVKEMVQIESLAQVGVQLLLFGLGMEFSFDKMREVGSVAILGGALQIALFIAGGAAGALAIGAAASEGLFVGALVSMSSTSVVIKSLGERSQDRASQIVIGTLILQDCSVGLMFALMPVLASLNDPASSDGPEARGEIVLLVLQVLFKLAATLAAAFALSRSIVPAVVSQLRSRFSDELFQLAMIGYCLTCAWICGKLGLSHELGAFLAGIMISTFEHHASVAHSTEQVRNVFIGLFLASIGLVISPVFILEHVRVLSIGAAIVLLAKASLITLVVRYFRIDWTTSVTVGISLAQVGEFAFVMLSLASQLGLISARLSMLLLGVTAISLLTTPIVFTLAHAFLPREAALCLPLVTPTKSALHADLGSHGHGRGGSMADAKDAAVARRVSNGGIGVATGAAGLGAAGLRTNRASAGTSECVRRADDPLSPWVSGVDGAVVEGGAVRDGGRPGRDAGRGGSIAGHLRGQSGTAGLRLSRSSSRNGGGLGGVAD